MAEFCLRLQERQTRNPFSRLSPLPKDLVWRLGVHIDQERTFFHRNQIKLCLALGLVCLLQVDHRPRAPAIPGIGRCSLHGRPPCCHPFHVGYEAVRTGQKHPSLHLFVAHADAPYRNKDKEKTDSLHRLSVPVLALPIFPVRLQTSIFGAGELNFRVRNGNGCDPHRNQHQELTFSPRRKVSKRNPVSPPYRSPQR